MKLLALEHERTGATARDFEPHLRGEARHVWELQQQGIVREIYFRPDQHTAVLILECADLEAGQAILAGFPLVRHGLIRFELMPLAPYPGFARLFQSPDLDDRMAGGSR
jgi:muconolactone delta-isomerase